MARLAKAMRMNSAQDREGATLQELGVYPKKINKKGAARAGKAKSRQKNRR